MLGKQKVGFSFSKKAEPKRVVEALVTKKDDGRQEVTAVEDGQVTTKEGTQPAGALTIPCKNPLNDMKRPAPKAPAAAPKGPAVNLEEAEGGLISRNLSKLSKEDAEAMQELLKDANSETGGEVDRPAAAPILMREGSQKARDGSKAPEATKDMFENVPVESFGEAMLRGMGYDPSIHKTKPVWRDKLRDNCLGLGAKALLPSEKMPASAKKKAAGAGGGAAAAGSGAPRQEAPAQEEGGSAAAKPPAVEASERQEKRRRVEEASSGGTTPGDAAASGSAGREEAEVQVWASRGLVVRVVCKDPQLKEFYGAEAVVLEVDQAARTCRIKSRVGGKSQTLPAVPLDGLETRVSRDCKSVRVVRGPRRGAVAKLVERDSKRNVARISLEGSEVEMPLDDVCQFMV